MSRCHRQRDIQYIIINLAGDSFGGVVQAHKLNVGLPASLQLAHLIDEYRL